MWRACNDEKVPEFKDFSTGYVSQLWHSFFFLVKFSFFKIIYIEHVPHIFIYILYIYINIAYYHCNASTIITWNLYNFKLKYKLDQKQFPHNNAYKTVLRCKFHVYNLTVTNNISIIYLVFYLKRENLYNY